MAERFRDALTVATGYDDIVWHINCLLEPLVFLLVVLVLLHLAEVAFGQGGYFAQEGDSRRGLNVGVGLHLRVEESSQQVERHGDYQADDEAQEGDVLCVGVYRRVVHQGGVDDFGAALQ